MKYFDKDGKHNFVDARNAFVGYDSGQGCCENADFALVRALPAAYPAYGTEIGNIPVSEAEGYDFDPAFFQKIDDPSRALDDGGAVAFRLTRDTDELFLILYNCHNGYYGHGFDFTVGGVKVHEGIL